MRTRTFPRHLASIASSGLLVAIAWVALSTVPAAVATTAPGQVYVVTVSLSDQGMVLPIEKNRHGRTVVYQRGASVRYNVINQGTKPYAFLIGTQKTRVIPPGHQTSIEVHWSTRGKYRWERLYHGKPIGQIGLIRVN
jgi:hypothetical protein